MGSVERALGEGLQSIPFFADDETRILQIGQYPLSALPHDADRGIGGELNLAVPEKPAQPLRGDPGVQTVEDCQVQILLKAQIDAEQPPRAVHQVILEAHPLFRSPGVEDPLLQSESILQSGPDGRHYLGKDIVFYSLEGILQIRGELVALYQAEQAVDVASYLTLDRVDQIADALGVEICVEYGLRFQGTHHPQLQPDEISLPQIGSVHIEIGRQVHGTIFRPYAVDVEDEAAGNGLERLDVNRIGLSLERPDQRNDFVIRYDEADRGQGGIDADEGIERIVVELDQLRMIFAQIPYRPLLVSLKGLDPQGNLLQTLVEIHKTFLEGVHLPEEIFLKSHHLLDQFPLLFPPGNIGKGDLQREYPVEIEDELPSLLGRDGFAGHVGSLLQ